jgi:hypothetical protein
MKIRTLAMNKRGYYVGSDSTASDYCVFSLQGTDEIRLGDSLSGDFVGSSAFGAKNLTNNTQPWIQVEATECSLSQAIDSLLRLGAPNTILVGLSAFPAYLESANAIREEVLKIQQG